MYAMKQADAAGATVDTELEDFTDQFSSEELDILRAIEGVPDSVESFKSSIQSLLTQCARSAETLIIETVVADENVPERDIDDALDYLIAQFVSQSENFDSSTVSASPSYGGSNVGDGVIVSSVLRADGRNNEGVYAETLELTLDSVSSDGSAFFRVRGEREIDRLNPDWPGGSGINSTIASHIGASGDNLVTNANFNTVDDNNDNLPEGWIAEPATFGTTLKISDVEVQTVTQTSTPTDGFFTLKYTDANSDVQETVPLAWNASAADVQSALQALNGLGSVTVSRSGASAPFTYTITFTDVANPTQLTSVDNITGGSLSHATTTAGNAYAKRSARVLELDSDGSENTALYVPVSLEPNTLYGFSILHATDSAPAAGVITCDLIDGIGGTVIADDQSTNNTVTVDATALTTSYSQTTDMWVTPDTLPSTTYLRIYISTDISNTSSVYIGEAMLVPATELYTDGVSVAIFTGDTDWNIDDTATVAVSSNRAGEFHEWLDRMFDLKGSRKRFPTAGTGTQQDSLIA